LKLNKKRENAKMIDAMSTLFWVGLSAGVFAFAIVEYKLSSIKRTRA